MPDKKAIKRGKKARSGAKAEAEAEERLNLAFIRHTRKMMDALEDHD